MVGSLEPRCAAAGLPSAPPRCTSGVDVAARAVLPPLLPLARVRSAVRPGERSLPGFAVCQEAALEPAAIGPRHSPSAVHLAFAPLPLILSAVRKAICPMSIHAVLLELTHISRAIGCRELSMAVFHAIPIPTLELRAVPPHLYAL